MKKVLLSAAMFLGVVSFTNAQLGAVAPDFTVTDIDGNSHNLYSILEAGKVVILDVSATWCGPCWNFHEGGYLEDLNAQLGPDGTDQIRVIFYEGDAVTALADLQGTTSGTQGDWITGATFPIINETPLQLNLNIYAPDGFPTINVINPNTKVLEEDLFYNQTGSLANNLQDMIDVITEFANPVSIKENLTFSESEISLYPSPSSENIIVDFGKLKTAVNSIIITNALSQTVRTISINANLNPKINVSDLENGIYFLNLNDGLQTIGVKRFSVQH